MKPGPRADKLHVAHIVEAGERILGYLEGIDEAEFLVDRRTQDAVVLNFQVMGEAAKRISAETRAKHPDVPWSAFARFRDVLIHRYDQIVPGDVWRVATEELPAALEALEQAAGHEQAL